MAEGKRKRIIWDPGSQSQVLPCGRGNLGVSLFWAKTRVVSGRVVTFPKWQAGLVCLAFLKDPPNMGGFRLVSL